MKTVKLTFYDKLRCSADKCPESCCGHRSIYFSRQEYLRIKNAENGDRLRELTERAFVRVRNGENAPENPLEYALIRHDSDGTCPFLDDGLCIIQKELGEDHLGCVCASFPRLKTRIGDEMYFCSLDLSCPEAAKLLIEETNGLAVHEQEYDGKDEYLNRGIYTAPAVSPSWEGMPYYRIIKYAQLDLLRDRSMSVSDRMLVSGYFAFKVNDFLNRHETEKIPLFVGTLKDAGTRLKIAESLRPAQSGERFAVTSAGLLAKMLITAKNKGNKRLNELFSQAADSIDLVLSEKNADKNGANISTSFDDRKYYKSLERYRTLEKKRPHICESLLCALTFMQPLDRGVWKNYFILAIFYNAFRTCLPALLYDSFSSFSDNQLAAAISRAVRMTIGSELVTNAALMDFVDNRSYTLPHAAFLVGD